MFEQLLLLQMEASGRADFQSLYRRILVRVARTNALAEWKFELTSLSRDLLICIPRVHTQVAHLLLDMLAFGRGSSAEAGEVPALR